MILSHGYQEIEIFSPERPDEALTQGIRLRALWRGFQHCEPQVPDAVVEMGRENTIPIMDKEAVAVIRRDRFTQLLQCP